MSIVNTDTTVVAVSEIKPHPNNARLGNVDAIAESIRANGFYGTVIVRKSTGHILAGTHRWKAAQQAGLDEIPVTFVDVDAKTAKRIMLADNRTSDLATYDDSSLADLLRSIGDLSGTGWTDDDLARLLADVAPIDVIEEEETSPVEINTLPSIAKAGDLWLLGPHRLICGDSRNPDDVARLLDGATINLGVTSPPYADRRKYDETSGFKPIPPDEYVEWFVPIAANVARHLAEDGSWIVNIKAGAEGLDRDLYVMDLVIAHVRAWGWHFGDEYCWERVGVPKQPAMRFKNQWEPIYQFSRGRWKFRPENVRHASEDAMTYDPEYNYIAERRQGDGTPMRRKGRGNTSWQGRQGQAGGAFPDYDEVKDGFAYPGNRLPNYNGSHEATGHSAAYPVGLPAFFIKAYTDPGDVIYDPFTGSGSSLLAAHQTERIGYGVEISPAYVDIICNRFERHTGITPINAKTGNPVSFLV